MKGIIAAIALAILPSLAIPIAEQPGNAEPSKNGLYTVSRADALPNQENGVAWLFTAADGPKAGKGATLKFYQRNDLVKSGKGEAWVLELDDSIDTKNSELVSHSRADQLFCQY
jgi:hypothetical protein